ncbi:hypothetical protein [Streptomyces cylindrosporus]|uniref:DNA primase/polymerase bifunctional N-terminal domain-containing protein n=1 Tax=Streptomyces cylindrosporus TaxID=2927583 RepID=A0ABS9YK84_9ACTN|nr:hypothetical protein [Streptomyces cylindrosporus]MCI3277667.1 hypothetical protein [Streptomyces cylindrosporus]
MTDSSEPTLAAGSQATRELAVAEWLLVAAHNADEAVTDWRNTGLAVLECGGVFAALRIPALLVVAAARTSHPGDVAEYLAGALHGGPVIVSANGDQYYALVPPSTAKRKLPHGIECLTRSSLLFVPRPDLTDPNQHAHTSYWAVPMDGPGALCQPDAVLQVATVGRFRHTQQGGDQ